MKIFITGGSGLLGGYLNRFLSEKNEILTQYNSKKGNCKNYSNTKLDITDFKKTEEIIKEFSPDAVIHTAAVSRPELCDEIPLKSVEKINIEASKNIARLCEELNCKMIFTSTDLVYDGDKGGNLKEDAYINPVSLYAESKYRAEQEIIKETNNYVILRTALLLGFGSEANNFEKTYHSFREGKRVRLFYDQFRTPLTLINGVSIIGGILNSDIKEEILNFGGADKVNRTAIGEMICEIKGFDKSLIDSVSLAETNIKYKVFDVSLNTDKLKSFGLYQVDIRNGIEEIISDFEK